MNLWNKTATEKTSYRMYIVLFTCSLTKLFRSFSDTDKILRSSVGMAQSVTWGRAQEWYLGVMCQGPHSCQLQSIRVGDKWCFVLLMFAYVLCLFYKYSQLLQSINKQKTPHTKQMTGPYL